MSAPITRRVARLIGTARPRPSPATAVLTPTTRSALVTSAPPELPGFSEASVWITLSIVRTISPARPAPAAAAGHHVRRRQQEAVAAEHDRAARAHGALRSVAPAPEHAEVR